MENMDEMIQEINEMKRKGERLKRRGLQAEGEKKALIDERTRIYETIKNEFGIDVSSIAELEKHYEEIGIQIAGKKDKMAAILRELGDIK